jgi:hypothetical protein
MRDKPPSPNARCTFNELERRRRGEERGGEEERSVLRLSAGLSSALRKSDLFQNWSLSFTKLVGGRRAFSRGHDTLYTLRY